MAVAQPVWSRVDEPAHFDVIAQYASGVYPHDSVTTIRPETLDVMQRTGVYGFIVDSAYAKPDVPAELSTMPAALSPAAQVLWIRRHGWQFSYEAFQPPLYYVAALPAWLIGRTIGGPLGAVYAVRVFDALLAALLAPMAMLIALRIWPMRDRAGWAAAVLSAILPGVALNLTSVTNDVLVSVLGGACILVAINGSWTRGRVVAAGLLLGAALLTKTTAVALVPALAYALLDGRRAGGGRQLLAGFAVAAGCIGPWLVSNVMVYGELISTREQLVMAAFPPRTSDPGFWGVSTLHSYVTFWTGDPFLSVPGAVALALVAALLSGLAIAGLWRARRSSEVVRAALRITALAAAGAAVVAVASPILAAFDAPGRLAYVGLAGVTALVAIGLWFELHSPRLVRGAVGLFGVLSMAGMALLIAPQPAAELDPGHPVLGSVTAIDAHGTFGGVGFDLLRCAVDPARDVWLSIRIVNAGDLPAEWSQSAEVRAGDETIAVSDYARSTPFPVSIQPGSEQSGWLWLGPSNRIAGHAGITVAFRQIATDGYRSIGDVVIPTALC